MNIFSEFEKRVADILRAIIADGCLPADLDLARFVEDAINESARRLAEALPGTSAEVRAHSQAMIAFSAAMQSADKAVKTYLFSHMYRHPRVMVIRHEAAGVVERLLQHFLDRPGDMPGEWGEAAANFDRAGQGDARLARLACDYIAGMTDRYALAEHRRLFGQAPELR